MTKTARPKIIFLTRNRNKIDENLIDVKCRNNIIASAAQTEASLKSHMAITKVPFDQIPYLSTRDKDYQQNHELFEDFYSFSPDISSFEAAIDIKKKNDVDRTLLVRELKRQYSTLNPSEQTVQNIESLSDNETFTIVTAHQPSLFTGPLYYPIKILSCIKACRLLKKKYPTFNFVPVLVHGGEDHDFEEVNHCHLFGKTVKWHSDQGGPVGRFDKNGLEEAVQQLKSLLEREPYFDNVSKILDKAFAESEKYGDFVFNLVDQLFGHLGLVQLNMDSPNLKAAFVPYLLKEILERKSEALILETQSRLNDIGYKAQAYPREINLFYLTDGRRDRLDWNGKAFEVLNTDIRFSTEEIQLEVKQYPERFSPNVALRPIYQEIILPNLAYLGGGGELAYWLERKTQFEYFKVPLPILLRRDSVMVLTKKQLKTIEQLGFSISNIFKPEHTLITNYLLNQSNVELSLQDYVKELEVLYSKLANQAEMADPTLKKYVLSEFSKQEKSIGQIESRIKKAYKQKEEISVNKIKKLKAQLFPNGNLQERVESIWPLYARHGSEILDRIMADLNVFEPEFKIYKLD